MSRMSWHHKEKSADKMIAESAATGIVVGGIVAIIVNTLGIKTTIVLCIIGYFVWKHWDAIKAFFA